MKLKNSIKIAFVAAALCGIDTGNVFATLSEDISAVSGIKRDDVENVFDVIKRSIKNQIGECYENGELNAWLRLEKLDLQLDDMTKEKDKIKVLGELRKYVNLFSQQIDDDYKLYVVMYHSELVVSLFGPNMEWAPAESRLIYRLNSDGDYEGYAWLISTRKDRVSINLEPSAMNDYEAVRAIKTVTDEQLNDLQLDDNEKNCIQIIKTAGNFVDCRRELRNRGIGEFWNFINEIMAKLQEKGYLGDDCHWKMPVKSRDVRIGEPPMELEYRFLKKKTEPTIKGGLNTKRNFLLS